MTLFNTLFTDGGTGETYSLGIFSTKKKATDAFNTFMTGLNLTLGYKYEIKKDGYYGEFLYNDKESDLDYTFTIIEMETDKLYS